MNVLTTTGRTEPLSQSEPHVRQRVTETRLFGILVHRRTELYAICHVCGVMWSMAKFRWDKPTCPYCGRPFGTPGEWWNDVQPQQGGNG